MIELNLRQREMSDADTMKQKSIAKPLKALYLPTGYLTLEDAMEDATFRKERAPFWRDCPADTCEARKTQNGDYCKKKSSGRLWKTTGPSFETKDGPVSKSDANTNKLCCCKEFNPSAPDDPGATPGADKIAEDGQTTSSPGFFEANLLMGKMEVTAAGTIVYGKQLPAQEMCTMRLSFENKRQTPTTGWAKGAHEMWLAKPVPCDATRAHGGDRFHLKFSKQLHEAQQKSFSEALSGGVTPAQSKLESKDGEFCFAWPEKGDWRYAYQATIYQCVNSECDSEENALAIAHSAEKALTVEVFDKLTQVKDNTWRLDGIAANMKAMQENRRSHFVKSPLKMAIAVTDTNNEATQKPWVYFSFEKLKGTLWHDERSLERGVGRSVGGGAAEVQDETDAELDELERLIDEEEEAHALGGTARGKRGGATHANALLPGGVDTEREERRRKEVFASLDRTEAEAPRLQSEHDVDELSRWLVSLARRVDGLRAQHAEVLAPLRLEGGEEFGVGVAVRAELRLDVRVAQLALRRRQPLRVRAEQLAVEGEVVAREADGGAAGHPARRLREQLRVSAQRLRQRVCYCARRAR